MTTRGRFARRFFGWTLVATVALGVLTAPPAARAIDWNGSVDANWDTGANWSAGVEPVLTDDVAFPAVVPGTGPVITLTPGEQANSLAFNSSYTLTGGTLAFGTSQSINVGTGLSATIASSMLDGSGATSYLKKGGAGTLILTGDNSAYTRWMDVNGGVVSVRTSNSMMGPGSYFHVTNAASVVQLEGGITVPAGRTIYLSGTATNDDPSFRSTSGTNAWNGTLTLHGGGGNHNVGVDAGSTLILGGLINQSAVGNLVKVGDGTLVIQGTGTYTGSTWIKAGTLQLAGGANRLPTTTVLTINNGKTFDLNGQNQTLGGISCQNGNILLGGATLTVNGSGDIWGFSTISGAGGLTKSGGGLLTIASTSTYTGPTSIDGGTLCLYYKDNVLPTTTDVNIAAGAALGLSHSNAQPSMTETIGRLSGSGTVTIGYAGRSVNFVVGNGGGSSTFAGVVENGLGTVALTKTGTGTIILTGANTYGGATNVNQGALNIRNNTALGSAAAGTSVASAGQLQLENNITVAGEALTLDGSTGQTVLRNVSGDNTWAGPVAVNSFSSFGIDGGSLNISGPMSGNNRINKNGAGTLILSGDNSAYTGGWVDVNAGVISVRSNNGAIGGYFHVTNASTIVELTGGVTAPGGKIIYLSGTATNDNPSLRGGSGTNTWGGTVTLHNGGGDHNVGVDAGGTLILAGTVDDSTVGNLVKVGPGTLVIQGAGTYRGYTQIKTGTLALSGTAALTNSPLITVDAGATFDVSGVTGGYTLSAGRTLNGYGTVIGPLVVNGTHAPGTSIGIMTEIGDYTLAAPGTLQIELGGTAGAGIDPGGHDQLVVSGGDVNLAGTLDLLLGYAPGLGDSFVILDNQGANAIQGTFAGLPEGATLREAFGGYDYPFAITYRGYTGNDVVLTAVPEPGTLALLALGVAIAVLSAGRLRSRRTRARM